MLCVLRIPCLFGVRFLLIQVLGFTKLRVRSTGQSPGQLSRLCPYNVEPLQLLQPPPQLLLFFFARQTIVLLEVQVVHRMVDPHGLEALHSGALREAVELRAGGPPEAIGLRCWDDHTSAY